MCSWANIYSDPAFLFSFLSCLQTSKHSPGLPKLSVLFLGSVCSLRPNILSSRREGIGRIIHFARNHTTFAFPLFAEAARLSIVASRPAPPAAAPALMTPDDAGAGSDDG